MLLCVENLCTPGANEPGGLGSDCATNGDCATDKCANDGNDSLCTASCDAILAQIRSFADQGQASQADALGMKAAVSGCDPKAISEAARVKKPAPKH